MTGLNGPRAGPHPFVSRYRYPSLFAGVLNEVFRHHRHEVTHEPRSQLWSEHDIRQATDNTDNKLESKEQGERREHATH